MVAPVFRSLQQKALQVRATCLETQQSHQQQQQLDVEAYFCSLVSPFPALLLLPPPIEGLVNA
jgi:hypothetical protein